MKTLKRLIALVAILPPGFAAALTMEAGFVAETGAVYADQSDDEAGRLRSMDEVEYWIGVAAEHVAGIEVVILHPDCTATSSLLGQGRWGQDEQGLGVGIVDQFLRFPGQEPPRPVRDLCPW